MQKATNIVAILEKPICFAGGTQLFRIRIKFVLVLLLLLPSVSKGQDRLFGSQDDPSEQVVRLGRLSEFKGEGGAGFSLIGPQWYTGAWFSATQKSRRHVVKLSGMLRAGLYGAYDPDTDELYDVARIVQVLRFESLQKGTYVRLGPLNRTRFGTGHLVNFLNTDAVYDERTVGFEAQMTGKVLTVEGFSEDVFSNGLMGARISVRPLSNLTNRLGTLSIGASAVVDRKIRLTETGRVDGQEADIRMNAYDTGGFSFFPFFSFARLPSYGQGFSFGADVEHDNFVDFARLHFRLALHYNSSDFRTGYFGAFYTAGSHRAHILSENESTLAGYQLREIDRGNSIESEVRVMVFNRFEFWYAFLRYHGVQPLSEYHLRLMFTSNRFNLSIGQDRRGLVGFRSLFDGLGDENRMRFEFEYRLIGPLWARVNAEYTYVKLFESVDAIPQHIVQRRFSPMVILRYPTRSR